MADVPPSIVYGTNWCPDCKRAKKFMGEHRIQCDWIDVDADAAALAKVEEINGGKQIISTILFADGSVLAEPSNAELASKLRITTRAERDFYQLVIVVVGPDGLTAELYAAREGSSSIAPAWADRRASPSGSITSQAFPMVSPAQSSLTVLRDSAAIRSGDSVRGHASQPRGPLRLRAHRRRT